MKTWRWVLASSACGALLACGARTGLPGDLPPDGEGAGGAGLDAGAGAGGGGPRDAGRDVHIDAPAVDAATFDASRIDCADAGTTYIYVVTTDRLLLAFMPETGSFSVVGTLDCPTDMANSPFSMAVDRKGRAYVVYSDGSLFRVSTATAACKPTSFVAGQRGFTSFGMGFSTNQGGPAETLFIASPELDAKGDPTGVRPVLDTIDLTSFALAGAGVLPPQATGLELSGTGDGRLYGFYAPQNGAEARLAEIDKKTGDFLSDIALPGLVLGEGWAFGVWGGAFYFFTAPPASQVVAPGSLVTRYRPTDGSLAVVASFPGVIVGAGVSTCAPAE